jgi:hypothetical protein
MIFQSQVAIAAASLKRIHTGMERCDRIKKREEVKRDKGEEAEPS